MKKEIGSKWCENIFKLKVNKAKVVITKWFQKGIMVLRTNI